MGCEALIKAKDTLGPKSKGHIIYVKNQPCVWAKKEGLPNFIQIEIPDANENKNQLTTAWHTQWSKEYDYEILDHDLIKDSFRLRLFNKTISVSGLNNITREQVENYLLGWNAKYNSSGDNDVIFDFGVYEAGISYNFWSDLILSCGFDRVSYNQQTGVHVIDIDYNLNNENETEKIIGTNFGAVGSKNKNTKKIRFSVDRELITKKLKEEINIRFCGKPFEMKQYYISHTEIDKIVASGGKAKHTLSEINSFVRNRMNE